MNLEDEIIERLRYDTKSGKLFWKELPETDWKNKRFNNNFAGKEAGSVARSGYKVVVIKGKTLAYHRICWFLYYGSWPIQTLDHIDGNKLNNKLINLRDVSQKENLKNKCIRKDNTSGTYGVYFKKDRNKWRAQIVVDNKPIHLGYFYSKKEAVSARKQAENLYNFHKNHGRVV